MDSYAPHYSHQHYHSSHSNNSKRILFPGSCISCSFSCETPHRFFLCIPFPQRTYYLHPKYLFFSISNFHSHRIINPYQHKTSAYIPFSHSASIFLAFKILASFHLSYYGLPNLSSHFSNHKKLHVCQSSRFSIVKLDSPFFLVVIMISRFFRCLISLSICMTVAQFFSSRGILLNYHFVPC